MSAKGGYQIIDFKGVNHEPNVGMVHEGIYDIIEGSTGPFMASNIVIDDIEVKDVFIHNLHLEGSTYKFSVYNDTYVCSITDHDIVTFA